MRPLRSGRQGNHHIKVSMGKTRWHASQVEFKKDLDFGKQLAVAPQRSPA